MSDIETIRAHTLNALAVNPQSVDARDKATLLLRISQLQEVLAFLLNSCGGHAGGSFPFVAPSENAVTAARNALNIPTT